MTNKQRVKVNAALSFIYSEGYDVDTVVHWAMEYQRAGHDPRSAFQAALNDFARSQPELTNGLSKVTRLIEASDVPTVAKYDQALNAFIQNGDDSALVALGPMIARDGVALAVKLGEVDAGEVTPENVEAALGLNLAAPIVTAAAQSDATPANPSEVDQNASQTSPFNGAQAGGRIANQARWDAAPVVNTGAPRTLTQGHQLGTPAPTGATNQGSYTI